MVDFEFSKIEKYVKRVCANEIYDLTIYGKFNYEDDDHYEHYYIQLVYDYKQAYFTKEELDVAEAGTCSIRYIDVNWVLSQSERPTLINSIAHVGRYTDGDIYCSKCDALAPFYVKRTNLYNQDYKIINAGCFDCKYNTNTEFSSCFRCKKDIPIWVMDTNVLKMICKSCDIYLFDKTLLCVPYSKKDEVKKYGACFDTLSRKWYVKNNNKDINIILSKWNKTYPDQSNTKHPY